MKIDRIISTAVSLLVLLLGAQPVMQAQGKARSVQVRGRVMDSDNNPVPGAAIMVKDAPALGATVSDSRGAFSLSVPEGQTVVVSCIGFADAERVFNRSGEWLVVLEEDALLLDDVVVVGYGTQKKESVVGSISQIGTESLINSGTTNITNALAGKLAGVLTFQSSGQPGNNDAEILVRGVSSWNGSAPLVMVDGVERPFSELDPNEVKTISVLKDASATAVFGAKGANGVILVTTKSGIKGKPKMGLTAQYGVNIPQELPTYVPSGTIAELMNVAYRNDNAFGSVLPDAVVQAYKDGSQPYRYPDNNWYALLLKPFSQTFNVNYNISGGTDRVRYYVSVGYENDGSIVKQVNNWQNTQFKYHKINYRSNIDVDLTRSTTLSAKIGGSTEIVQRPGDPDSNTTVSTLFTQMYMASPAMFPAYYPASVLDEIPDLDYPDAHEDRLAQVGTAYTSNPYTTLANGNFLQTTTNRLNTDLILNQKLDFITKGLSLKGLVSLTSVFSRYSQRGTQSLPVYRIDWEVYDAGVLNPWTSTESGNNVYVMPPYQVVHDGTARSTSIIFYWEASVNYARKFGKHNVSALALMNQRESISGSAFPHRGQAYVARATYDYAGKYLLEVNMGYTGSEQFSTVNRFGFFPSAAVGYVLSKEKFWKKAMPWWSKMKLRYSDGLVGSDNASENWLYYSSFSKDKFGNIVEDKAANLTARWETAHKRDLGIELGFFKDKLTFNVDFFDEYRYDMLVAPTESPLIGITSKDVNSGSVKKHGLDIEAKYRVTTRRKFYYEAGFMLGLNENRILTYEEPVNTPAYQKWAGSAYKAARTGMDQIDGGYFGSIDDLHGYPNPLGGLSTQIFPGVYKLADYSADGVITTRDLHAIDGVAYPPAVGSVNFAFGYKGFSFNMLWYGTYGKYIEYNRSFWKEFIKSDWTVHAAQLDYWRPDNPDATHPALSFDDKVYSLLGGSANTEGYAMMIEGQSWRKSDYLTLKEVYLSYKFDGRKLQERLGLRGLSLTLTANNLLTFTGLLEGNPQRTELVKSYYPIMRTVKLGLKLDF